MLGVCGDASGKDIRFEIRGVGAGEALSLELIEPFTAAIFLVDLGVPSGGMDTSVLGLTTLLAVIVLDTVYLLSMNASITCFCLLGHSSVVKPLIGRLVLLQND